MGACSSCFRDDSDGEERVRPHSSRRRMTSTEREIQREQLGRAAEERQRQAAARTGTGVLSKKLAEQNNQKPSPPSAPLTDTPLQAVQEALDNAGLSYQLPRSSAAFACGDGNACEEAPIGYYRFHFWKNDEDPKEHENWIANTDVTGPMCISLMEDCQPNRRKYYRFLVRTVFGTKSIVLFSDDISELLGGQKPSKLRLIGASLRVFTEHERDKICALEDEFGAMSIRTTCSVASVSEGLVRSLPSSRLRDAPVLMPSKANMLGSISQMGPAAAHAPELNLERASSLRKRAKEVLRANPFDLAKSFTQVKDKGFCQTLLELERSFDPKVCHFDVIIADGSTAKHGQQEEGWRWFSQIFGKQLTKQAFKEQSALWLSKCGRVPSNILAQQLEACEIGRASVKLSKVDQTSTLRNNIIEFVSKEWSYVQKLQLLQEYFVKGNPAGLHDQDIKQIFENLDKVMKIHESMLYAITGSELGTTFSYEMIRDLVHGGQITSRTIAEELVKRSRAHEFSVYNQVVGDLDLRQERVKKLLESNITLKGLEDEAFRDPRSGSNGLVELLAFLFQHPQRCEFQLKTILEHTHESDPSVDILVDALNWVHAFVLNLEVSRQHFKDVVELNKLSQEISGCPAIADSKRSLLCQLDMYEVDKNSVREDRTLTLVLCHDLVLAARKRKDRSGKLGFGDQKENKYSYSFFFMAPVSGITIKRLDQKAKRGSKETQTFIIELDPASASMWHVNQPRNLESILEEEGVCCSFIFAPKDQKGLEDFIGKFNRTKHQQYLSDSPADIYLRQGEERDIYFHIFKQIDYFGWQHKNRVALLYSHQAPLPDLYCLFPEGETDALVIVQAMSTAFRWMVRTRECLVSSPDVFESLSEFHHAQVISGPLLQALVNCHLLHFIYPPFSPQVELQMRQQLVQHVEPYSQSVVRKFRELVNRIHKTEPKSTGSQVDDGASVYSVEQSSFFDEPISPTDKEKKKKTVLGKMFGRFKSPLANIPNAD